MAIRASAANPRAPDDVRSRVLTAALELIERDGLDALSMREVARIAGVSHQAPYHYFADREAILAAMAQDGFGRLADALDRCSAEGMPPNERLAALARAYVRFALGAPALFKLMFRPDLLDGERFPEVHTAGSRAFEPLPRAIQACIAAGLPDVPSAEALVVLGWSFAHGLASLLVDGCLAMKMEGAANGADALVDDVTRAMDALIAPRMTAGVGPSRAKAKRTR